MAGNRRISDIECLRGIAVVMVILFHARFSLFLWKTPLWDHIEAHYLSFWPGVDLFFAISGFVIARSLIPILAASDGSLGFLREVLAFWLRRFWRLTPSAWLWLFIMLACSAVINRPGMVSSFHTNFEATIAGMLSVANFRFDDARPFGYGGISTHYWSLSLEEQFYLLLPLVILVARRHLTFVLTAITLVVFLLPQTTMLMACRLHAVLLGVLLAIVSRQPIYVLFEPVRLGRWPGLGAIFGIIVLGLISALAVFDQKITPHNVDVIALLCGLLVLIASYDRNYFCRPAMLRHVMNWLGSRSYALYLVHVLVFVLTREFWIRTEPPGTAFGPAFALRFALMAAGLMIFLAEVNYRWVERPLRNYGRAVAARIKGRPIGATHPVLETSP